jgi:predicted anti-sigma-YlaC factor YlaD
MTADHDTEMACKELVEAVTDYLEGAMPPGERRRFEDHLGECTYCIEYLDQMRQVAGGLGGLRGETIAPERRDALLAAFRDLRV